MSAVNSWYRRLVVYPRVPGTVTGGSPGTPGRLSLCDAVCPLCDVWSVAQDPAAITALRRCIQLDPACLPAYMALAASYTNESYPLHACAALRVSAAGRGAGPVSLSLYSRQSEH